MLLLAAIAHAATTVRWFAPTPAGCTWNEAALPSTTPQVLVTWASPCTSEPLVAVSGNRTLVRTDLGVTELVDGGKVVTATVLGAPPVGEIGILGFDKAGTIWALTLTHNEPEDGALVFEGKRYSTAEISDGLPALAHAYRWTGRAWKRTETTLTTSGWDYAQEASALTTFQTLVPHVGGAFRTFQYADWVGVGERAEDTSKDLPWLDGHYPHGPDTGEWQIQVVGKSTRVAWWAEIAEFLTPALPVLVDRGAGWEAIVPPGAETNGIPWTRHMCDGAWLLTRVNFDPAVVRALDGTSEVPLPIGSMAPVLWPVPGV